MKKRAGPLALIIAAALTLGALELGRGHLRARALAQRAEAESLAAALEAARQARAEAEASRGKKAEQLAEFKASLGDLTRARRALYESGLQLQAEKRQLEKQWEIVSTYLLLDEESGKIHLMRGEQALESYPVAFAPSAPFGGEARVPAEVSAIVSKERFAHPERPRSEAAAGAINWEPPQVGVSTRAAALGEFVMFTRGPLILHGPPTCAAEHAAFPHHCAGLTLAAARRLYQNSFIGTRIMVKRKKV